MSNGFTLNIFVFYLHNRGGYIFVYRVYIARDICAYFSLHDQTSVTIGAVVVEC